MTKTQLRKPEDRLVRVSKINEIDKSNIRDEKKGNTETINESLTNALTK